MLYSQPDLVEEFCIDSTYKTNRQGSELFGVLANVNGAGYPITYLLYNTTHAPAEAEQPKTTILTNFFGTLHNDYNMHPAIMISDKDTTQMGAIRTIIQSARSA